ncbi:MULTISPECIES: hypothetical protein [unclassified Acetobacterium]|uniref:hypothetical protein n=1 Tax=unclassified Acetobacterium TaxID=2638182 RepID=UPI000DBEB385|nr:MULTISPECIES: hypothetical protein [unclassified Acetobacterium]AWW28429.1 hypothetical protein DOZ58_18285 [Acetobacterium sp. KB-1]MDZ5726891.1 hypothetical protein [Acetobacterium sp. K1/6]
MDKIIQVTFGQSRSKQYKKTVQLAKEIPHYCEKNKLHSFFIDTVDEYFMNQDEINKIIEIVRNWKGSSVLLYGKEYKCYLDFCEFITELKKHAGKYSVLVNSGSDVSMGDVTIEKLPMPVVLYPSHCGAFFAFSDDVGEDFYFCECERKAIENYIKLRIQKPLQNRSTSDPWTYSLGADAFPPMVAEVSKKWQGDIHTHIKYKENLCFRCNKKVPKKTYCHPMYGGKFQQLNISR